MNGLKEFGESAARSILERIGRGVSRVQERKPLPYDLLESDDAYLVVFDTPGVQRSDVQVRFLDGEVQVQIDRFRDFHEGFEMRFPGRGLSLDGSAELPGDADVDASDASATLAANGTLRVEIPKSEDDGGREVAVTDEGDETVSGGGSTGGDGSITGDDGDEFSFTDEGPMGGEATDDGDDATGSSTGVSATDAADGVGTTDSTDIDPENVDRDVASADPDREDATDDEDAADDEYEMSSVEETVAESEGETVEGDTDPDEDRR